MTDFATAAGDGFWLGTHKPDWVADETMPALFLSRTELARKKRWPTIRCAAVAVDSGGFSEVGKHGRWEPTIVEFADFVYRCAEWGARWVGAMDWVCAPPALEASGHTVDTHQALTVEFYANLRALLDAQAPGLGRMVTPVVQGWTVDQYVACLGRYERAGVLLDDQPLVGVGSLVRDDHQTVADILVELAQADLRIHAFGVHRQALAAALTRGAMDWRPAGEAWHPTGVVSFDSMAWSYAARARKLRLPQCDHKAANCSNCPTWALEWRTSYQTAARAGHARWLNRQGTQLALAL